MVKGFGDMAVNINNDIFFYVEDENFRTLLPEICGSLARHNTLMGDTAPENPKQPAGNMDELREILETLPRPYTIVQEHYHIDKIYRDTYYRYFSSQHFAVKRHSRRFSFYKGIIEEKHFYDMSNEELSELYMGSLVINPLVSGMIGKTLIDPAYLLRNGNGPVYMRLSRFDNHIFGKTVHVRAFPYRMQDGQTTRCAEITLLNILEYYSNNYAEYKDIVPSDILEKEQQHSHQRVVPSRGMDYALLSKLLFEFGFYPRLYDTASMDVYTGSLVTASVQLRRLLYYYVESGIPVAVNLSPRIGTGTGHSVVCIGHGPYKKKLMENAEKLKRVAQPQITAGKHAIINSADFYDSFVVVDDNKPVYQLRGYDDFSGSGDMSVSTLAAPLYKRMYLDAPDAEQFMYSVLFDEPLGIGAWAGDFLEKNEPVVMRLFMASSRSLKEFRSETLKSLGMKQIYASIPMPRFVWVCELYRVSDYLKVEKCGPDEPIYAFAEIIADATSVPTEKNPIGGLIAMHYPGKLGYRFPEDGASGEGFKEMGINEEDGLFRGYGKNLTRVG